jgi:Zn finger protein HypA/HybF involved in hydrogenase expression
MHEWHIASEIVGKIEKACTSQKAGKIREVKISLGEGLGITKEEFKFCLVTAVKEKPEFDNCNFDIELVKSSLASIDDILVD